MKIHATDSRFEHSGAIVMNTEMDFFFSRPVGKSFGFNQISLQH